MPLNVQSGRFADLIRKRLGVQGHSGLNLIDDVFVVAPTWPIPPEEFLLRGDLTMSARVEVAAVAAQFSWVRLGNPPTSGRLIVLEEIRGGITGGQMVVGWDSNTAFPASNLMTTSNLDGRGVALGEVNQTHLSSGTAAASTLVGNGWGHIPPGFVPTRIGAVIQPGQMAALWVTAVNVALSLTLVWREFRANDEELRG